MILCIITCDADNEIVERFKNRLAQRFGYHQICVTWPYSTYIKGKIKNSPTVQFFIIFSDRFSSPEEGSERTPSFVRWHFDFASYVEASDLDKKRQILESVHAACLWAAEVNDWDVTPFNDARDKLLTDDFRHLFVSRKGIKIEGLPTKVKIALRMELETMDLFAVVRRTVRGEDILVPLVTTKFVNEDYENKLINDVTTPGPGLLAIPGRDGPRTFDLLAAIEPH